MQDMVQGSNQDQGTSVSSSGITPATSTPVNESSQAQTQSERLFKQSEINDIVGKAKHEAVERYKRANDSGNQQQQNVVSHDEVRRMAAEEIARSRDEWIKDEQRKAEEKDAQRIAGDFFTKLSPGKDKYEDFGKVIGEVDFGAIPNVVHLSTMVDNTHDVMYDLAKNPIKIAQIQQLYAISPKLAYSEMQKLANSLKENDAASKVRLPNDPLSPLKPSTTGTDNGVMSISDYKKKYGPGYKWSK